MNNLHHKPEYVYLNGEILIPIQCYDDFFATADEPKPDDYIPPHAHEDFDSIYSRSDLVIDEDPYKAWDCATRPQIFRRLVEKRKARKKSRTRDSSATITIARPSEECIENARAALIAHVTTQLISQYQKVANDNE